MRGKISAKLSCNWVVMEQALHFRRLVKQYKLVGEKEHTVGWPVLTILRCLCKGVGNARLGEQFTPC